MYRLIFDNKMTFSDKIIHFLYQKCTKVSENTFLMNFYSFLQSFFKKNYIFPIAI